MACTDVSTNVDSPLRRRNSLTVSDLTRSLIVMPLVTHGSSPPEPLSAAEANEAIRRFVAGRTVWTPTALAELARLRAAWMDAMKRETTLAA